MKGITLLKNHVVFTPIVEEDANKSKGGIILTDPENSRPSKKFLKGQVVAIGKECSEVAVGNIILYPLGSVLKVELGGEDYHLIDEGMIFAVIT